MTHALSSNTVFSRVANWLKVISYSLTLSGKIFQVFGPETETTGAGCLPPRARNRQFTASQ